MVEPTRKPRLLIFIVAYAAESTLRKVLDRIPRDIFDSFDCEVLVIDDASPDQTFTVGQSYQAEHRDLPIRVLRNEYNQGYGGNQKAGYTYALDRGFDYVALIHGDGQYAPEELPNLLRPLVDRRADAVLGSRMMTTLGALNGGMPLYKFLGNRILTTAQNTLLGSRLTEFHSGYRVYSTAALRRVKFQFNTNDFHFDTEIIIQLMNAGQRIVELPIPTYYGTEICRVNGIRYACEVMRVTLQNFAHRAGVLYQWRFDPVDESPGNAHYDLKLGYPSSHQWALDAVPPGARVLDIGAGPGGLARLLAEKGCEIAVVDQHPPAESSPIPVIVQDLDDPLAFDAKPYDHLLMLDVIEHLRDPERFMERLRAQFDHRPKTLILTTPNIAFFIQRGMLLFGQFNYGKAGILDRTHTRLFTIPAILRLLRDNGYRIKEARGIPAPFPKVVGNGRLGRALIWANSAAIRASRSLFSYQVFVVAESTPATTFVVRDTLKRSDGQAAK